MKIYVYILIAIALIAFIIWFRVSDNALRRNLRAWVSILILVAAGLIAVFLLARVADRLRSDGVGVLLGETEESAQTGTLEISISGENVFINGVSVDDMDSIRAQISQAAADGSEITLIDDYALAAPYREIESILTELGINDNVTKITIQ